MTVTVQDNPTANRYEATVDGEVVGFADYERTSDTLVLTHTEVEDEYTGEGVAGELADSVLDHAREAGLAVIPQCTYMAKHIGENPELIDLVPADRRAEFDLA